MKNNSLLMVTVLIVVLSISTVYAQDNAPDFTLTDINGQIVQLSERLQQGPVLIDFWATWCKPCKQELPHVNRISEQFADSGLQVWAVSTDNARSQSRIKPFIRSKQYTFDVMLDPNQEVRRLFGGVSIPFTVLIAQSGEIVYQHLGYVAGDEVDLIEAVEALFPQEESPEEIPDSLNIHEEELLAEPPDSLNIGDEESAEE
ncbi:MAG: TlpA disulfide reductase family protein [Candidatus Electryoneaceae bacterium]|nr:TlpA disulfide reductase family protein [Candidatus Electryoneaceae bacterium]